MSKMANSFEIGVNLRVTECLDRGSRNYMEDYSRCYFEREKDSIVFGFFAVFDGHGGSDAANFAKQHLVDEIKAIDKFWSDNDEDVQAAIKEGFLNTHQLMWKERDKWPRTLSGYKSTAGTTASIVIIRSQKMYIGHVGDSAVVMGHTTSENLRTDTWTSTLLTVEHKPGSLEERSRIESVGGRLMCKAGVERVVWSRPKGGNSSRRSNEMEQIPFLAVARSLGDLWSYDSATEEFHVSPEPDVMCIDLNHSSHRCVILGSDGLWNMVSPDAAVEIIRICERETERKVFLDPNSSPNFFFNPAASLVKHSLKRWSEKNARADNISALVVMFDPPGPSMSKRRLERRQSNFSRLGIPKMFESSSTTLDSYLGSELLVECGKWKSANKPELSPVKKISSNGMDSSKMPVVLARKRPIISAKPPVTPVIQSQEEPCDDEQESDDEPPVLPPTKTPEKDNVSHLSIMNMTKDLILNTGRGTTVTPRWNNDLEVWEAIVEFLYTHGYNSAIKIHEYLSALGTQPISKSMEVMPWTVTIRRVFDRCDIMGPLVGNFGLFHQVWVSFYESFIIPAVGVRTISKRRMMDVVLDHEEALRVMLTSYNKGPVKSAAKRPSGTIVCQQPDTKRPHLVDGEQLDELDVKVDDLVVRPVSTSSLPSVPHFTFNASSAIPSMQPIVLRSPILGGNIPTERPILPSRKGQLISARTMARPVNHNSLLEQQIEHRMMMRWTSPTLKSLQTDKLTDIAPSNTAARLPTSNPSMNGVGPGAISADISPDTTTSKNPARVLYNTDNEKSSKQTANQPLESPPRPKQSPVPVRKNPSPRKPQIINIASKVEQVVPQRTSTRRSQSTAKSNSEKKSTVKTVRITTPKVTSTSTPKQLASMKQAKKDSSKKTKQSKFSRLLSGRNLRVRSKTGV